MPKAYSLTTVQIQPYDVLRSIHVHFAFFFQSSTAALVLSLQRVFPMASVF